MSTIARSALSLDGLSAGPDGWPALVTAPYFDGPIGIVGLSRGFN